MERPVTILMLDGVPSCSEVLEESLVGLVDSEDRFITCRSLREAGPYLAGGPELPCLLVAEVNRAQESQAQPGLLPGACQQVYYLALLNNSGLDEVNRALEMGAEDFLVLPPDRRELAARLAKGLKTLRQMGARTREGKPGDFLRGKITRESEDQYRNVVERANDGIVIIQDSALRYVNPKLAQITGFTVEELTGRRLEDCLHPSERERLTDQYNRRLAGEEGPSRFEAVIKHRDGSDIYVEFNAGLTTYQGRPADMVIIRDITQRKKVEEALRRSEERYREILDQIQEGYYEADLQGNITFCNEATCSLLRYTQEEMIGMNFHRLYRDPARVFQIFNHVYQTGLPNRGFALEMIDKDGNIRYGELSVSLIKDENGKAVGFRGVGRDVTERKEAEEQIRYLSFHDKLTGLFNRAFFEEEIRRLDTERQVPLSILIADTNGLKLVNDAFGHHVGDDLLLNIAQLLRSACRREDIICRWGGDEFAVLLPKTSPASAKGLVQRIQEVCRRAEAEPIPLSVALGIATKEVYSQDIFSVVKKAETEMYGNKLQEAKHFRNSVIASLVQKLGEKGYETKGHAWRMQNMSVEIGTEMGLPELMMDDLILAVTLHDIGKIAVPEHILKKPGPLAPEEWELVKEHAERGYRIALTSMELAHIAPVILAHHEHWNGGGYPQGLKREKIPLLSRLLAVIEAYDVMIHASPYKDRVSPDEAIKELQHSAGTQFDPRVVETFVHLYHEGRLRF